MSVDTRDKRSSAIHLMLPWRNQMPNPSGTIDAAVRAMIALLYSGFYATPSGASSGGPWLVLARRRFRR